MLFSSIDPDFPDFEEPTRNTKKRKPWKWALLGVAAFFIVRNGCSPVSIHKRPTGNYIVTLPDTTSPSDPRLAVRIEEETHERVRVLFALDVQNPSKAPAPGSEVIVRGVGIERTYRTDDGGMAYASLIDDFGLAQLGPDDQVTFEVEAPVASFRQTKTLTGKQFLNPYYDFGRTPLRLASGESSDEQTVEGVAYRVLEELSPTEYRVAMSDGGERLVTATNPRLVGYGTSASPVDQSLALLPRGAPTEQGGVGAPSAARLPGVAGKTHVLLVAVNEYESFPKLTNPVPDAEAVQAELRDMYGCETTLLRNPTRNEFRKALFALADRAYKPDDQLLVFISGHGWFDEKLKRGFLAMKDGKPFKEDALRDTLVPHEDVRTILERLDCRHVMLVVDSCFSGTLDPVLAMAASARQVDDVYEPVARTEYIRRKLAFQTRRYITAGGKEYVSDGRPGQHSPFSRQFLAALRSYGGADGVLTLEEMLLHLDKVTPQPRSGELIGNEPGSSFVLVARTVASASTEARGDSRQTGEIVVSVTPAAADVTVLPVGAKSIAPMRALRVKPDDPRHTFQVPAGTYRITASLDGYVPSIHEVTITGGSRSIVITLKKQ
ncbi:caspase family protein [Candidatus Poribacteria bacterium]|nr:caspase family protein [Candidatus Poribacteria bacterium]